MENGFGTVGFLSLFDYRGFDNLYVVFWACIVVGVCPVYVFHHVESVDYFAEKPYIVRPDEVFRRWLYMFRALLE